MFSTLRSRLWLTYAFLSGGILLIVAAGMIVYIIRNPFISRQTVERLNILGLVIQQRRELLEEISPDQLSIALSRADDIFNARFILLSPSRETIIDTRANSEVPLPPSLPRLTNGARNDSGQFRDTNWKVWLYARRIMEDGNILLVASPRPRVSIRHLIREDFTTPFVRAMLIALILALIFAYWVSDWVTAPLRRISDAAENFSGGKYHRLKIEGPQEVKELAQSFNNMSDQVIASQKSQRDLVANISHDLKTPLTSIKGYAQAILDGTANTYEEIHNSAEIIFDEAEWMNHLVADLMELARYDSGVISMARERIEVSDLFKDLISKFQIMANAEDIRLNSEINEQALIIGDRDRLVRVFSNIIENALKYTPPMGEVNIICKNINEEFFIEISDTGPGVPPEELPRIFERFYQVEKSRRDHKGRGIGLGLSISKEIVDALGGSISAYNNPQHGMTFVIKLPVYDPSDNLHNIDP